MSKSLGNVINPTDVIEAYGADTMPYIIRGVGEGAGSGRPRGGGARGGSGAGLE